MPGDRLCRVTLAHAPGTEHQRADEGHRPGERVDHRSTGKVVKAGVGKRGRPGGCESVPPYGPQGERIDQDGHGGHEREVCGKPHAFGHGAGNDGRRRAAERQLKQEVDHLLQRYRRGIQRRRNAKPDAIAEHQERDRADRQIRDVLLRDVDDVAGPHASGFQQQEAGLHAEHQDRGCKLP